MKQFATSTARFSAGTLEVDGLSWNVTLRNGAIDLRVLVVFGVLGVFFMIDFGSIVRRLLIGSPLDFKIKYLSKLVLRRTCMPKTCSNQDAKRRFIEFNYLELNKFWAQWRNRAIFAVAVAIEFLSVIELPFVASFSNMFEKVL